jgi:simple sugar transport system permease protein
LILGALAGVIGERSGVVNVALEGQLLLGAFVAAVAATMAGSVWAGVIGGALAGVLLAAILAVLAIRYLVDQVIVGVVLNLFALGITNFLYQKLLANNPQGYNSPGYLPVIKIPLLGDIPIIGPVLFDGTIFLYITYALVALVHFGLFHTRWGLRLRAVGEHPKAADTVGIKVQRTRYRAVLLAGVIAGLAGAFLVVGTGSANTFVENMSSGKGFIALAAVIFGRWTPVGAVAAALLFGFANQLQILLSQAGVPIDANLLLTAPYIATIIAVAGRIGRIRPPAADGQPYLLE